MTVPRSDDVEHLAGLTFTDPFRRLEDGSDSDVVAWQRAQAASADAYAEGQPWHDELRDRVADYTMGNSGTIVLPRFAGGRWFRIDYAVDAAYGRVVMGDAPMEGGELVLDPVEHVDDEGRVPFVSWVSPSPDGLLLAVGLCHDGSEANTIRVVDVGTSRVLDDRPSQLLMDNWNGGAPVACRFQRVLLCRARRSAGGVSASCLPARHRPPGEERTRSRATGVWWRAPVRGRVRVARWTVGDRQSPSLSHEALRGVRPPCER